MCWTYFTPPPLFLFLSKNFLSLISMPSHVYPLLYKWLLLISDEQNAINDIKGQYCSIAVLLCPQGHISRYFISSVC